MRKATVLCLMLMVATGCGGGGPQPPAGVDVRGKILLPNGAPLTGGTLVLRPEGGLHAASTQIQSDGAFALAHSAGAKAVVPGKYQVFVTFNDANQNSLRAQVNRRYQSSEDGDSDVFVQIQAAVSDLVIKLNR